MSDKSEVTFSVKTTIDAQRVADLMVAALEGGSNYWIDRVEIVRVAPKPEGSTYPWYAHREVFEDRDVQFKVFEEDEAEPKLFTFDSIQKGLDVLSEKYPTRIAEILSENYDADTADVFLQCCLLGDVVYG